MKFFKDIHHFLKKHNLPLNFNIQDGYFITLYDKRNNAFFQRYKLNYQKNNVIFLDNLNYVDMFKEQNHSLFRAVKFFMKLNKIHYDSEDPEHFIYAARMLSYFLIMYKRNISLNKLTDFHTEIFTLARKYLTVHNVKVLYRNLMHYLMYIKGLSKETSQQILYNCNSKSNQGLDNIRTLLNSIELMQHPMASSELKLVEKSILEDICDVSNNYGNFINFLGDSMEDFVNAHLSLVTKRLKRLFGSTNVLIIPFDEDKKVKDFFKKKSLKCPDYLYLDDKLNLCALDSKFSVQHANFKQISKESFTKTLNAINFYKELAKLNK